MVLSLYAVNLALRSTLHEPVWLLPIGYTILFILCTSNRTAYYRSPGATTLNTIMFLRFQILPLVILFNGEYEGFVKSYDYIEEAIYLMVYEMLATFLALEFFMRKLNRKNTPIFFKSPVDNNFIGSRHKIHHRVNRHPTFSYKHRDIVLIVSIISLLIMLYENPSLVRGWDLLTQGFIEEDSTLQRAVIVSIMWQILTTWTYVYLVFQQKENYDKNKNSIAIIISLAITFVFLLLSFIAQSQISRWYTIINSLACLFFLLKLFPKRKRSVSLVLLTPLIFFILVTTIYKNVSRDAKIDTETAESVFLSPGFLNSYLAGPSSVNNAIGLYETGEVSATNIPNDILNNMPIVNHFLKPGQTTVYKYNDYIGRVWVDHNGDQIIPLIGQGLAYFGPVFSILICIISVFFVRYFDISFFSSNSVFMYLLAFSACWMGVEMCLNMTINLSWFWIRIIPMWGFFYLVNKLNL